MENIDFDNLMHEIDKESALENIEKQLEELKKVNPHSYVMFDFGRRLGRSEIIGQMLKIVKEEEKNMIRFMKQNRGNE